MTVETLYIVYPEGEEQEIGRPLRMGQIVDLNGNPLSFPLSSERVIAYRVVKIRREEGRGTLDVRHYTELVPPAELLEFVR